MKFYKRSSINLTFVTSFLTYLIYKKKTHLILQPNGTEFDDMESIDNSALNLKIPYHLLPTWCLPF